MDSLSFSSLLLWSLLNHEDNKERASSSDRVVKWKEEKERERDQQQQKTKVAWTGRLDWLYLLFSSLSSSFSFLWIIKRFHWNCISRYEGKFKFTLSCFIPSCIFSDPEQKSLWWWWRFSLFLVGRALVLNYHHHQIQSEKEIKGRSTCYICFTFNHVLSFQYFYTNCYLISNCDSRPMEGNCAWKSREWDRERGLGILSVSPSRLLTFLLFCSRSEKWIDFLSKNISFIFSLLIDFLCHFLWFSFCWYSVLSHRKWWRKHLHHIQFQRYIELVVHRRIDERVWWQQRWCLKQD